MDGWREDVSNLTQPSSAANRDAPSVDLFTPLPFLRNRQPSTGHGQHPSPGHDPLQTLVMLQRPTVPEQCERVGGLTHTEQGAFALRPMIYYPVGNHFVSVPAKKTHAVQWSSTIAAVFSPWLQYSAETKPNRTRQE